MNEARSESQLVVRALYPKLNFNFETDIAGIGGIGRNPFVMTTNPAVPAKTVAEFIAYGKANPGRNRLRAQHGMIAALADLDIKVRFATLGMLEYPSSSAEFATYIAAETEKWAKVIKTANVTAS